MNSIRSYRFEGIDGNLKMQDVMKMFRFGFKSIGGIEVENIQSLGKELDNCNPGNQPAVDYLLPNAVEYRLAGGSSIIIRPSESDQMLEVSLTSVIEYTDLPEMEPANLGSFEAEKKAELQAMESRIWNDIESIVHIDYRAACCYE